MPSEGPPCRHLQLLRGDGTSYPWSSVHGSKMTGDGIRDHGSRHDGSCTPGDMLLDDVATAQIHLGERPMATGRLVAE